ncbi:MAG: cytochrome P450 [Acidimicrobiales bacterium]|nr:cytochrome P450 [Acidimicrobiales bacterium]MDP6298227.1 cytochrome P450 [Acidimicrobiales bacterium]HJM29049.1 cytochrome P450 [Acidimicrobiales bacterium]HJM98574.1 cytochrome P450 [Acidimicrobiales bacterium]
MDHFNYDPVGPEILEDPIPSYSNLREQCPVHQHQGLENPVYSFSRYADVQSVLVDQDTWSNRFGPGVSYDKNVGDLQRYDPPDHQIRRRFLRSEFLPRTIARSEPAIQMLADELIDNFYDQGRVELHDNYALPLPVKAFTELMGISDEDSGDFKTWADELTLGMTYPDRSKQARKAVVAYTTEQVRNRREAMAEANLPVGKDPVGTVVSEGLISHLSCHPLDNGEFMPDEEVASMIGQLLVAGHETTTSLITNAIWRLLLHPEQMNLLRENMDLVPNAIEESLRFDSPVLGICKTNNLPVEYHQVEIPQDSKVMVLYASANRDGSVFSDPDVFRVDRPLLESKRHLSFGWGAHFCLGAHLARLVGRLALETLLNRISDFRLDEPTERVLPPFLWGRKQVTITWD